MRNYILLIVFVLLYGCDIQKRAVKSKTQKDTQTDIATNSKSKVFDFSKTVSENESWSYEPSDPSQLMTVITKSGDTLKTKNTKITKTKNLTNTNYNKRFENDNTTLDNSTINEDSVSKQRESEHNFDAKVILYGFGGLAIVIVIIAFIGMRYLKSYLPTLNNN